MVVICVDWLWIFLIEGFGRNKNSTHMEYLFSDLHHFLLRVFFIFRLKSLKLRPQRSYLIVLSLIISLQKESVKNLGDNYFLHL